MNNDNRINLARVGLPRINLPKALIIYQFATVVLYVFGPIHWKTHNPIITFGLIFGYILCLWLGFHYGKNKYTTQILREQNKSGNNFKHFEYEDFFVKYYYIIFAIAFVLRLISITRILRLYGWSSILVIIDRITTSYSDLYSAEQLVDTGAQMYGGTAFSVITVIFSPLTFAFVPMFLLSFKRLSLLQRALGCVQTFLWVIAKLSAGTSQGFFNIIICVFTVFILVRNKKEKKVVNVKKRGKYLPIIIGVVLMVVAFNFVMSDRMGKGNVDFWQKGENVITQDGIIYNLLPVGLRDLVVWVDFYLVQGYYGLSLATTLRWVPMFGTGSSRWLCLELSSAFSEKIYESTYQMRIEQAGYKWGASANWHSAYSWFANDVSFIGVFLVMFLIGCLFVKTYYEAYRKRSLCSVGLLSLLIQMIIFLPSNNIAFSDSNLLMPFIVYTMVMLFKKNNTDNNAKIKVKIDDGSILKKYTQKEE